MHQLTKNKLSLFSSGNTISSQNASKKNCKATKNCLLNSLLLLNLEGLMCRNSSNMRPDENFPRYQRKAFRGVKRSFDQNKLIICAFDKTVICNEPCNSSFIAPCTQEEADKRDFFTYTRNV